MLSGNAASSGVQGTNMANLAEIRGSLWNDWNGNGLADAQERGAVGLSVFLDGNHNGQWDSGEPCQSPDATGAYAFPGLSAGVYAVGLALAPGWKATLPTLSTTLQRVSLTGDGLEGNARSGAASISADGRFVAFASQASNLAPADTNGKSDIFVYDRQTQGIERISLASDGTQANGPSDHPFLSADGRFVAFDSLATNLVPGDSNGTSDVFVFDRQTQVVERVSLATGGQEANGWSDMPSLSSDGRYVAFESEARNLAGSNGNMNVYLFDRLTQNMELASRSLDGTPGNLVSDYPALSADGRSLAFLSEATNLVPGDTNNAFDVFVYDPQSDTVQRLSIASDGGQANGNSAAPAISADGRLVAFPSDATNLLGGDTNGVGDIFVRDRLAGTLRRVSVSVDGDQANGPSAAPTLSADGRYLAYASGASNLVAGLSGGLTNILVADLQSGAVECVSQSATGESSDGFSQVPSLSADGAYVAFGSHATRLVPGDTNGVDDVFVSPTRATLPGVRAVVLVAGQTAANIDFAAGNPAEIYGLVGDNVRITRDAIDSARTAVFVNANGQTPTYTVASDEVLRWNVAGAAGGVGLVVDYAHGDPLPAGGLDFNGDPAKAGDSLVIRGTSAPENVTLSADQVSVNAGGSIRYRCVDSFRFELGGGGDRLTVAATTLTLRQSDAIAPDTQLTIAAGGKVILDTGPTDAVKVSGLRLNLTRAPSLGVSAALTEEGSAAVPRLPVVPDCVPWTGESCSVSVPLATASGSQTPPIPSTLVGQASAGGAIAGILPKARPRTFTQPMVHKAKTTQRRAAWAAAVRPFAWPWAAVWRAMEQFWIGRRRHR